MPKLILALITVALITSCGNHSIKKSNSSEILNKFAFANCLLWYFESKSYDTDDIRSISGGMVETSNISIDKFQQVALFVKSFNPKLQTKQDIDPKLLRCFYLVNSDEFNKIISE